ncbi:MAG: undecaprenyldiphospho-muramoylpentapeptide beta-N-acetylglucosaminyltransferase [Candidatus Binataceae bacterium]
MKVIIAGGGTGGHLFPAVALGEELGRERADTEVLYVGATNGLEAKWLPRHGLPHELLAVRGWTGKGPLTRLRAASEFVSAIIRARILLRRVAADLVVGVGGYASVPMVVAAILKKTPVVLLEQNIRPGLSNRLLWRFVRLVCVGFDATASYFNYSKVRVTGNPVRFAFIPHTKREIAPPLQILVLGGSSGAHRLNVGFVNALKIWGKAVININIVHQTGEADVGLAEAAYRELGCLGRVVPFIDDMAAALDDADLVIARAGAMTVSEIALASRAALFVPYPFHRDRQQELNARVLERLGGARVVHDDDRLAVNLAAMMDELTAQPARLVEMGRRAAIAAKPEAAARIARACYEVAQRKGAA